jgi:hypothetical protein
MTRASSPVTTASRKCIATTHTSAHKNCKHNQNVILVKASLLTPTQAVLSTPSGSTKPPTSIAPVVPAAPEDYGHLVELAQQTGTPSRLQWVHREQINE